MTSRILSEFQESILSQVAYDKMELSRRVITRDDANYKCSIEETGVLANMSETENRLYYYFGDVILITKKTSDFMSLSK